MWEKPTPALVAVVPAAKTFLMQNYAERREDFVFPETAQTRFASLTKGQFDKLYRISGRNGLADEVQKSGCADYFYNARGICTASASAAVQIPRACRRPRWTGLVSKRCCQIMTRYCAMLRVKSADIRRGLCCRSQSRRLRR